MVTFKKSNFHFMSFFHRKAFWAFAYLMSITSFANAQDLNKKVAGITINYDENNVPDYQLPELLISENGDKITSREEWFNKRRPEILSLFKTEQFGLFPEKPKLNFNVFENDGSAFNNKASRTQVRLFFTEDTTKIKADLLIYLPKKSKGPVPLLLKIGFSPNSNAVDDPELKEGMMWTREGERVPASQGRAFKPFDVEKFLDNGIGVATIYYGDIEPDYPTGLKHGIRGHYLEEGEDYPAPNEWGTISAWSWGLSYAMDYLVTNNHIDSKKVALYGISRLGKTVLWAGAIDQRFGMVIASCSGEGGAAISRRQYGETIHHMVHPNRYFYQFSGRRAKYSFDPNSSPIDSHMLLSLIAPRPLLLQTGDTDYWSDPKGEFDAAVAVEPVYELLGAEGLQTKTWPAAEKPILKDLGYYMHAGGHGSLPSDNDVFIDFLKMRFINK